MSYGEDSKPEEEQSEPHKALAKQWGKRLEKELKKRKEDKTEKRYKELRAYVRGDVGDDGETGLIRTNIIHSNFAAILPQIYAKNPEIAVSPTESVGSAVPWVPGFCKTLQPVLHRKFVTEGKLKKRAKSAIRSAMTTAVGWAKVSWQNEDQLRFVLREGKKRQIRRMCELVGLHVVGLKRIRIGSITLGKLPVGQWRYLRPEERF